MVRGACTFATALLLLACRQQPGTGAPADEQSAANAAAASLPDADINASLSELAAEPAVNDGAHSPPPRYVGRWATDERLCQTTAWTFIADELRTADGKVCRFSEVRAVPGGYDIAARCGRADEPVEEDALELRFAESAGALLLDSRTIGSAGLISCANSATER